MASKSLGIGPEAFGGAAAKTPMPGRRRFIVVEDTDGQAAQRDRERKARARKPDKRPWWT